MTTTTTTNQWINYVIPFSLVNGIISMSSVERKLFIYLLKLNFLIGRHSNHCMATTNEHTYVRQWSILIKFDCFISFEIGFGLFLWQQVLYCTNFNFMYLRNRLTLSHTFNETLTSLFQCKMYGISMSCGKSNGKN